MLYVRCWGEPKNKSNVEKYIFNPERNVTREVQEITKKQLVSEREFFFLTEIDMEKVEVGAFLESLDGLQKKVNRFLSTFGLGVTDFESEEVVSPFISDMLDTAEIHGYINRRHTGTICDTYGFNRSYHRGASYYGESVVPETCMETVYLQAEKECIRNSLTNELDRIYQGKRAKKVHGHPVHYMIETDDDETAENTVTTLVQALYENGRVSSRRVTFYEVYGNGRPGMRSQPPVDEFYSNCSGTVLAITYHGNEEDEGSKASSARSVIEDICRAMQKNRNDVLTILILPKECTKTKEWFSEYLGDISIVELKEEFVSGMEAKQILARKAKESHVRTDKQLLGKIQDDEKYLLRDLNHDFEVWYGEKLKRSVYPQYREINAVKKKEQHEQPKGSAFDELTQMIGLSEAKKVIRQALDYYKARKLFREKGMKQTTPSMHMVFTGNPGTAKTTVARLFARIMKDNGVLSGGHLVEVGRSDLVGKYVGWTAPTVKKKFQEAKGGVLFIDEAYSLVDDRDGLYGDEAINTIVQEMENHREELIVIFAGYPDKMDGFLQKNPGLRSRIAFHVSFADYDVDELCEIAGIMADKFGMAFTEDAVDKLKQNFIVAMENSDFGNGRYVRNVLEKARMAQASRLVSMDLDLITRADVATICGEDIELPEVKKSVGVKLGFCG